MESRICDHCGHDFYTRTKDEKDFDSAFPFVMIIFPLLTLYCIGKGGWGWMWAVACAVVVIGTIGQKMEANKERRGKRVAPSRTCPSCDEKSADVDSPLGRQLILKWSDPSKMNPEFIDALSSIVSSVDDTDSSRRKQLIAKQPSPPTIDSQRLDSTPSTIPFVGEGDNEGVGVG